MAVTHGALIRQLRTERGLTQSQLVKGISSRGTLASLEKRDTKISFDLLVKYLDRMNITLEEYSFLYIDSLVSHKRKITQQMIESSITDQATASFSQRLSKDDQENGETYYHFMALADRLREQLTRHPYDDFSTYSEALEIKSQLSKVETWGQFELSLMINCLFIFDTPFIINAFNYRVTKMKLFVDSTYFSTYWNTFILNALRLSFTRNDTTLRAFVFKQIDANQLSNSNFDQLTCTVFRLLDQLSIDPNNGVILTKLETLLQSLAIIGETSLL